MPSVTEHLLKYAVVGNPLCQKMSRSRLRLRHVISWGTVVASITAFLTIGVYLTETEQELASPRNAARSTLIPIIVLQSVILMLMGTGSVASGLSRLRESGLLDYDRMTPMSPTSKIMGYLFGLPAREYFLFGLTLPFLAFAVIKGEFPLAKLFIFYAVFFSSVWVYHMTGMVAGMVTSKPRFASMIATGLVVVLYFVLPQLATFGLTFFEYLTIRPTLFTMIREELQQMNPGLEQAATSAVPALERVSEVAFFHMRIPVAQFSLLVQGFSLAFMFIVVHRKWRDEFLHPLSKASALLLFAGVVVFLTGSLWPAIGDRQQFQVLSTRLAASFDEQLRPVEMLSIMMFLFLLLGGALGVGLTSIVTPAKNTTLKGIRLARKLGANRIHPNSDAASSLGVTIAMAAVVAGAAVVLMRHASASGMFFHSFAPVEAAALPLALTLVVFTFVQGLTERFSKRTVFIVVFLLWMLPLFTAMVLYAAFEAWVGGTYAGLACPPIAQAMACYHVFGEVDHFLPDAMRFQPQSLESHFQPMTWLVVGGYAAVSILVQIERIRWRRSLWVRESSSTSGL